MPQKVIIILSLQAMNYTTILVSNPWLQYGTWSNEFRPEPFSTNIMIGFSPLVYTDQYQKVIAEDQLNIVSSLIQTIGDTLLPKTMLEMMIVINNKIPSFAEQKSCLLNFITNFHYRFFDKLISTNILETPIDIYKELPSITAEIAIMTYTKVAFLTLESKLVTLYTGQAYSIFDGDNIYYPGL